MNIPRAEVSLSIYATAVRARRAAGGRTGFAAAHLDARGRRHAQPRSRQPDRDGGQRRAGARSSGNTGRRPAGGVGAAAGQRSGTRIANALLGQLRLVRVHDARAALIDRQLGVTWRAPHAEIDLARRPEGGVDGTAEFSLAVGDQQARLTLSATLAAGASETHLRARLSPVTPSVIARAAPSLAAAGHAGRTGRRRGHARSRCQPGSAPRSVQPPRRQRPGTCRRQQRAFPRRHAGGFGHAG